MKISLRKRIIAFMLSVILLFSGSISGFASELLESDPMAEAAAAVVSEEATEPTTEATTEATETSAAIISEEITEATEAVTEKVTEPATEAVTEEATEAAAKEETVEVTEEEIVEETETETVEETEEETEETEETEEVVQVLEYEDNDVKIHVEAVGADAIPEGASLKVAPITAGDAEYNKVEQQLNEKAEGEEYEIAGFLAYDITFIDAEGNKVEPNGDVKVTMDYKKATLPEIVDTEDCENLDVTVMHLEEDAKGQVKEVVDMVAEENIEAKVKTTEKAEVEKAEFATNSFSVFTITWTRVDEEKPELSFNEISQNVHVLYADGTTYRPLDVTIEERPITSRGTPPTLYIDTITETGDNEALYEVTSNEETYRFVKAIVGTWEESTQVFKAKTNERVVAIQAIKMESDENAKLRYMLENTGQYSEFENGDSLAFVYTDGELTTKATYWTEDGFQLLHGEQFDFAINEFENNQGVEVLYKFPSVLPDELTNHPNNYIYSYVEITQSGDRIVPRYMRYDNGTLQYSMSEAEPREWHNVGVADIRLIYRYANTVATENTQGIVDINMFNYAFPPDGDQQHTMGYVEGIYFGTGWEGPEDQIYNRWTGNVDAGNKKAANLALQGMVKSELVNGYPNLTNGIGTGKSLASLFNTSTSLTSATDGATKEVYEGLNHLFIKGTDGYYSFNSSKNYAYYSAAGGNKNITIYDRPVDKAGRKTYVGGDSTRGDFMPFLPLGKPVADTANDESAYHLGMTIGFDFLQPEDNEINGENMIFEFSGDDDVWVFIDGKLVLDIGGIHSEAGGSINFTNGEVKVYAGPQVEQGGHGANYAGDYYSAETPYAVQMVTGKPDRSETTLDNIFKFPEGKSTFEPNSYHRLEFFYLERGADLSNCKINFNLQPVKPVKVRNIEIEKEIINTDKAYYGDIEFTYELYVENSVGAEKYDKIPEGTEYTLTRDGEVIGTRKVGEYGRFVLHHGESAIFEDFNEKLKYYVREVDVNDDEFASVSVIYMDEDGNKLNNISTNVTPDNGNETPTSYIAESEKVMVGDVYKMLFQNTCAESNKRELHIQKLFDGDTKLLDPNATFSFKVMLEDRDGKMVPYENGVYYLLDENGEYILENGEPVKYPMSQGGVISGIQVDQTIVIKNLMSGTDFYVEEIDPGDKYQEPVKKVIKDANSNFSCGDSDKFDKENKPIADGVILVNKNAKVEITNALKFDWEIIKVSSVGTDEKQVPLAGAKFKLKSTEEEYTGTSGADGKITWELDEGEQIERGTYTLTETKAPADHLLSGKEWTVEITRASIKIYEGNKVDGNFAIMKENGDGTIHYTITITNEPIYELPSTGGNGIYWYMIAGIILMMMAAAITYKNRRKEVLERYRIR